MPLTHANTADELLWLRRLEQRDQRTLAEIYQRYGGAVYGAAYRVLRNTTAAEEVTQDAFLVLWEHAGRWDASRGSMLGWMLAIARHGAIDRLRHEQRRPMREAVDLDEIIERVGGVSLDDAALQDGALLRDLMAALPEEQRQVVELTYYGGMTHTEMAARLHIPLGTVKTRLRLALHKLKRSWLHMESLDDASDVMPKGTLDNGVAR